MADAVFEVTDRSAPRKAVAANIRELAGRLAGDASARTPRRTGRMAASYRVVPGRDPGTSLVVNDVPYARFVEYGTRHMRASAPLGQAMANARRL